MVQYTLKNIQSYFNIHCITQKYAIFFWCKAGTSMLLAIGGQGVLLIVVIQGGGGRCSVHLLRSWFLWCHGQREYSCFWHHFTAAVEDFWDTLDQNIRSDYINKSDIKLTAKAFPWTNRGTLVTDPTPGVLNVTTFPNLIGV